MSEDADSVEPGGGDLDPVPRGQPKLRDIGARRGAGAPAPPRDFAAAPGVEGGHADSVGQREAGETHQVFDAAVHVQGAAGETVRAGKDNAAIAGEIDGLIGQVVAAGRGAGRRGGVGDQHAAADRLGADGGLQKGGPEVDAIDDETGHQAVFGELFPDVVGVAAEELVRAVAEVGGKRGAGGNGVGDLRGAGLRVADGGDHAFGGDALDVARGLGPFRGEGDDAYAAAGGVLPAVELVEIGRTDPLARMGAARAVFGRDVGAFNVEAVDGVALGD